MITIPKKRGFILVEAVLAIGLLSFSQLMRFQLEKENAEVSQAISFGKDISELGYALDRRVTLDGYLLEGGGSWNDTYLNTTDVVNRMIYGELISKANPECGIPSGWSPTSDNNKTLALLPCDFLNASKMPMHFSMDAKRTSSMDDAAIFSEWTVNFFHSNPKLFNDNFRYYQRILNEAKARDPVNVSGAKSLKLVDRRNDEQISNHQCISIGSDCAIQLKLRALHGKNQIYLRQDGQNAMHGSISFKSDVNSGENIKCYRARDNGLVGADQEIDCGIEIGLPDNSINFNGHEANVATLRLTNQLYGGSAIPIPVKCVNKSGAATFCGFSVMNSASPIANAYANNVIATDLIKSQKVMAGDFEGENLKVKTVTSENTIKTRDLVASNLIKTNGKIEANGDIISKGTTWSEYVDVKNNIRIGKTLSAHTGLFAGKVAADLFTGREAKLTGDISARNITASKNLKGQNISATGQVYAGADVVGNLLKPRYSAVRNGGCTGKAVATDASGKLMSCVSGRWSYPLGVDMSSSPVLSTSKVSPYSYRNTTGRPMLMVVSGGNRTGRNGCDLRVTVNGQWASNHTDNNDKFYRTCNAGTIPLAPNSTISVTSKPWAWRGHGGIIRITAFYL